VDQEPQPNEQAAEDHPETVGDRLLKWLGIDPNKWTVGDRRLALFGVGIGLTIVIIAVCGYVFGWEWTGLAKRTFWDWLSLLIVPLVLALGGYLFTRSENRRARQEAAEQHRVDQDIANQRAETDREIADQRRQDDALQAYLDHIGELLLDKEKPLRQSKVGDEVRTLARARTLSILGRLDGGRKRSVMAFLYESDLIAKDRVVVDLRSADLSRADLDNADLRGADLSGAYLHEARLPYADLREADLALAILTGAMGLTEEQLEHTKTLEDATMPNGQKYEEWLKSKGRGEDGENTGPY
jgi:hypothetical protein